MAKIHIKNLDRTIEAGPGLNLLNNFILTESPIHTVCGGRAMCGCCRIRVLEGEAGTSRPNAAEIARLGEELIEQGWRLSCQTYALRDITVYMPIDADLDDICSK